MRVTSVVVFILIFNLLKGQDIANKQFKLDSLQLKLGRDSAHTYRFKKIRPYLAIDNRNSFVIKAPINLRGLQAGIKLIEKHVIGIGFYSITPFSERSSITRDFDNRPVNQFLRMNYLTLFYKYKLLVKKYYEVNLGFEAGAGDAMVRLLDSNKVTLKGEKIRIYPFGSGVQFVLKPVRWLGLSSMGGYRIVNEGSLHLNFNGWFYSFGLWVDLRQVYRDIKYYGFIKKRYRHELKKITQA